MKQNKQDRRSQRTRHLVISAMMELMREKRYDAITVQDLLDRAGIGRSTFYIHYFDKEDVLESMAEYLFETLRAPLTHKETNRVLLPSLQLFQHVQEQAQYFQVLQRGRAGALLWEKGQALLSRTIEQALVSASLGERSLTVPPVVVAQYLAGSFLSLLRWWLEAEMPYSPEQMDQWFWETAFSGIGTMIEEKPGVI